MPRSLSASPMTSSMWCMLFALPAVLGCRTQETGKPCSGSQTCPIGQACESGSCVEVLDAAAGAGCDGAPHSCASGLVCATGYFMCAARCTTLYSSDKCEAGAVCACELGSNQGACVRDQCYADADCGAAPSGLSCAHFASDAGGLCLVKCALGSATDCASINKHCALFPGGTSWCSEHGQAKLGEVCDVARGPTACANGGPLPLACMNDAGTAEPAKGALTCHEVGCAAGACSGATTCVSSGTKTSAAFSFCK